MNDNFLKHISEVKNEHRKKMAKIPFEEKVKIIIELQKINLEMKRNNSNLNKPGYRQVWQIS